MDKRSLLPVFASLIVCGCAQEMMNQARVESQEETDAFRNGIASQRIPEHTIVASPSARPINLGSATSTKGDPFLAARTPGYLTGEVEGDYIDSVPHEVLKRRSFDELIRLGQQRYGVSCAPCHDYTGSGNGMVARRGFKFPASFHTDRLRQRSLGYLFHVTTKGYGEMWGFENEISTVDRWAIAAYVRTLQWSQHVPADELTKQDRETLSFNTQEPSQ